jgi:hypothetical protein
VEGDHRFRKPHETRSCEIVLNNYLLPTAMTDAEYELLAAKFLTALARRDMIVWMGHRSVWDVGASNSSVKGSVPLRSQDVVASGPVQEQLQVPALDRKLDRQCLDQHRRHP